ncbi:MAG: acyl-CoA dehydrogenase family protein [Thermodesulfobacteriota bacterium]
MKILLDLLLSDEHRMVRETTRKFAEKELGPLAHEIDEQERFPLEVYKKAGEQGLIGSTIPVNWPKICWPRCLRGWISYVNIPTPYAPWWTAGSN